MNKKTRKRRNRVLIFEFVHIARQLYLLEQAIETTYPNNARTQGTIRQTLQRMHYSFIRVANALEGKFDEDAID